MATAKLYLTNTKATSETRIQCILTDGRAIRQKFYSDISIKPKHWSKKNQTVLSANPNAIALNKQLKAFRDSILNIYLEAKASSIIADAAYIKEQLKPTEKAQPVNNDFWQVWEYYYHYMSRRCKPRTLQRFPVLQKKLQAFEAYTKTPLTLSTITPAKLEDLQAYFYEADKLNTQTAAKYIKLLKGFLNWAVMSEYSSYEGWRKFKAIQQPDSLKVIFSASDIAKLQTVELNPDQDYLRNTRDLLILSTLTALRYSDYSRIKAEHLKELDGRYLLEIRQQKTSDFVKIPLAPKAYQIVQDILQGRTRPISNQKMNEYVKELCQIAEVNEPFEVHRFVGKQKTSERVPKYELVTTHTGRRTCATNLILAGVPISEVMKLTGHKTYEAFRKYINIPELNSFDILYKGVVSISSPLTVAA